MENNLRYRHSKDQADSLGQVFTPKCIANLLLDTIPIKDSSVTNILDLGAGEGALTLAALRRFPRAKALLIEVDKEHANTLTLTMPKNANIINKDVLDVHSTTFNNYDVVVSNPPYGMLTITDSIKSMLSQSNLHLPVDGSWVRGDAVFAIRAWMSSSLGTGLGLIISSPIIRSRAFRQLREVLIKELSGLCVTQLDINSFPGAEVQAFLITGVKAGNRKRKVLLRKASIDGVILGELEISSDNAAERLDYDYYHLMKNLGSPKSISKDTLSSIGISISRGSRSNNDFKKLGLNAFHTTDFKRFTGDLLLSDNILKFNTAKQGDILIPRVGSRCLVNQARVKSGKGFFTDCVYRLRAKPQDTDRVWKTISSSFGEEWRLANASGNCAKHLTVGIILEMPLIK